MQSSSPRSPQSRLYLLVLLESLDTPHQVPRLSRRSRRRTLINCDTRHDLLDNLIYHAQIIDGVGRFVEYRKDDDADQWCGRSWCGQERADDEDQNQTNL